MVLPSERRQPLDRKDCRLFGQIVDQDMPDLHRPATAPSAETELMASNSFSTSVRCCQSMPAVDATTIADPPGLSRSSMPFTRTSHAKEIHVQYVEGRPSAGRPATWARVSQSFPAAASSASILLGSRKIASQVAHQVSTGGRYRRREHRTRRGTEVASAVGCADARMNRQPP